MQKSIFTIEERDKRLTELPSIKRDFLINNLKRGKKTAFANVLALQKSEGINNDVSFEEIEKNVEWVLVDIIDSGYVNSETLCECGRPLRYQYIVENQKTNQIKKFGIVHFEEHIGFPPHVIKAIKLGFLAIDYELDELLNKISEKDYGYEYIEHLPAGLELPLDILSHKRNDIPLLHRQRDRLKTLLQQFPQVDLKPNTKQLPNGHLLDSQEKHVLHTPTFSEMTYKAKLNSGITDWTQENFAAYSMILVQSGITSVNKICEVLVTEYGANSQRYSTGRYVIFSEVLLSISHFISAGRLIKTIEPGMRDVTLHFSNET